MKNNSSFGFTAEAPYERCIEGNVTVAALFVQTGGCYFGLPGVDPWDEARDARQYAGPHPVVAHPPCERWGRYWHGAPRKPHQYLLGDDAGCFASALASVRAFGGVLEHPKDSHAWRAFDLAKPPRTGGWIQADSFGGWTRGLSAASRKALPDMRYPHPRVSPSSCERRRLPHTNETPRWLLQLPWPNSGEWAGILTLTALCLLGAWWP